MRKSALGVTVVFGLGFMASLVSSAPPATESTTQPNGASDKEMLERALESVRKENPKAMVVPVRSSNAHLGMWELASPLADYGFYCATLRETNAAPARQFIAVSRSGKVTTPFDSKQLGELLVAADKRQWKDEEYLKAAYLYVHLSTTASQDGWKVLARPEDFTAIEVNMAAVGPGVEKQQQAAQQIKAPVVERGQADASAPVVRFYEWHLIGGAFRRWSITFGDGVQAQTQELGRFGGGGYD
ncbi:MAG TPA: hypothetical protein VIL86_14175 [Tepidisphaeraceae bacterium]